MLYGFIWLLAVSANGQQVRPQKPIVDIPIAGNTWQGEDGIYHTYVWFGKPGILAVWLKGGIKGDVRLTIDDESKVLAISEVSDSSHYIGQWTVQDSGYLQLSLTCSRSINPKTLISYGLGGSAVNDDIHYVKNNEGNFFYWGRRGPSTHLNYHVPEDRDIAYYYNEVTVPKGNDVVGSYFMADGFTGGYFGMQVNSATERRILFSVWSPFQTDNPKEIPADQQIKLLKLGEGVHGGEFGDEGAGGQSYLRYNWKAGNTYRFLLKGEPVGNNYTNYTAWFFAPELGNWQLIASFSRPKTQSWLKGFHSFLENFSPEQGIYERKVLFGNQWVVDRSGAWIPIREAKFSADNTARVGYRMDYGGGEEHDQFFLRGFGFFNNYTPIGTQFERQGKERHPVIDFEQLPLK